MLVCLGFCSCLHDLLQIADYMSYWSPKWIKLNIMECHKSKCSASLRNTLHHFRLLNHFWHRSHNPHRLHYRSPKLRDLLLEREMLHWSIHWISPDVTTHFLHMRESKLLGCPCYFRDRQQALIFCSVTSKNWTMVGVKLSQWSCSFVHFSFWNICQRASCLRCILHHTVRKYIFERSKKVLLTA